jgi:uncharacterized membrane protein
MTTEAHPNPDQKKIINLYAAFGASLLLSFVPNVTAAMLCALMGVGVLIAAYMMRKGKAEGSLMENHTTFIIRTIWIGGFFAMIASFAAGLYMFFNVDSEPMAPCLNTLLNQGISPDIGMDVLVRAFEPCLGEYTGANFQTFLISGAIVSVPTLLYFLVRFTRGLSRAVKGYVIAGHKGWF